MEAGLTLHGLSPEYYDGIADTSIRISLRERTNFFIMEYVLFVAAIAAFITSVVLTLVSFKKRRIQGHYGPEKWLFVRATGKRQYELRDETRGIKIAACEGRKECKQLIKELLIDRERAATVMVASHLVDYICEDWEELPENRIVNSLLREWGHHEVAFEVNNYCGYTRIRANEAFEKWGLCGAPRRALQLSKELQQRMT